jgi:hypothetical protein
MRKKKRWKINFDLALYFFSVWLFLTACGTGDLSRSKAKEMLEKETIGPIILDLPSNFVVAAMGIMNDGATPDPKVYESLKEQKVIILQDLGDAIFAKRYFVTFPPDAAKLFVKSTKKGEPVTFDGKSYSKDTSRVLAATVKTVEIDGITQPSMEEGKKVCYVEFKIVLEETPFSILLPERIKNSITEAAMNESPEGKR